MGIRLVFIRFLFIKPVRSSPTVDFPEPGGPAIAIRTLFFLGLSDFIFSSITLAISLALIVYAAFSLGSFAPVINATASAISYFLGSITVRRLPKR